MTHDGAAYTTFDVQTEAEAITDTSLWRERGQNSRTLLKLPGLRLVLMALKSGHHIQRHQTDLRLNLTTLSGRVELAVDGESVDLPAGRMLVLAPSVPHDVTALEDSVILLSLSSAT